MYKVSSKFNIAIVNIVEMPSNFSIVNRSNQLVLLALTPLSLTTPSTTGAVLSSDHFAAEHSHEYSDKRLDIYAEKIERLSNDVVAMKNQNDELNRQITYLKQYLPNIHQDQQE